MKGKMKAYSLFKIFNYCIYRYTSVEIIPELQKNILKFCYGINYKYEGMLAHSSDRFYVVIKFIFPAVKDLEFSTLKFDDKCECLQENKGKHSEENQYILDLIMYCRKIRQFVYYYKKHTTSFNHMAHDILQNEIDSILPRFPRV